MTTFHNSTYARPGNTSPQPPPTYLGDFSIENQLIILRATQLLRKGGGNIQCRKQYALVMYIFKRANENEITLKEARLAIKRVWNLNPRRPYDDFAAIEKAIDEAVEMETTGGLRAVQP